MPCRKLVQVILTTVIPPSQILHTVVQGLKVNLFIPFNSYILMSPISECDHTVVVFKYITPPSWSWSYGSWIYNYLTSLPITTKVVSFNPTHVEVYTIQHYVIKFVCGLCQDCGFLWLQLFPPPIKLTATHTLNYISSLIQIQISITCSLHA